MRVVRDLMMPGGHWRVRRVREANLGADPQKSTLQSMACNRTSSPSREGKKGGSGRVVGSTVEVKASQWDSYQISLAVGCSNCYEVFLSHS